MLVDTHAHLTSPELLPQIDQVIKRAKKAGVTKIVCASSNLEDSKQAIDLARKYPGIVYASVGLHPHDTSTATVSSLSHCDTSKYRSGWEARVGKQLKELEKLAVAKEVVAIGECGLDFTPPPPGERERSRDEQIYLFKEQVKLALRLGKPLIVHSRKAFEETEEILREYISPRGWPNGLPRGGLSKQKSSSQPAWKDELTPPREKAYALRSFELRRDTVARSGGGSNPHRGSPEGHPRCETRGVFHCYSAGKKGIEVVKNLGFLFGVDGNLTYDEGLQNVFREIPLGKILLETDAPWLAPVPHRGKISEPAHIKLIAEKLATVKSVSFLRIARVAYKNAGRLFGLEAKF